MIDVNMTRLDFDIVLDLDATKNLSDETKNNVKNIFQMLSDTGNMTPQEISEYYKDFISKVDERSNKNTMKKTTTTTNSDCPSNKAPLTEQVTHI